MALSDRIVGSQAWVVQLRDELGQLPETLKQFREGVANLKAVAERLETATAIIERTGETLDATGASDVIRQVDQASRTLEQQLRAAREQSASLPGMALMEEASDQLRRNLADMVRMLPRGPRPSS